jgi:hypothetical protein
MLRMIYVFNKWRITEGRRGDVREKSEFVMNSVCVSFKLVVELIRVVSKSWGLGEAF